MRNLLEKIGECTTAGQTKDRIGSCLAYALVGSSGFVEPNRGEEACWKIKELVHAMFLGFPNEINLTPEFAQVLDDHKDDFKNKLKAIIEEYGAQTENSIEQLLRELSIQVSTTCRAVEQNRFEKEALIEC